MAMNERDPVSGYKTTGHNWNGITELNTPVPKPVLIFLALAFIYAVAAWIVLPAWPLGSSFTKGLWQADQRRDADRVLAALDTKRDTWLKAVENQPLAETAADSALMARVTMTAAALFGQNCQPCHGLAGTGGHGFPRLNDNIWIWGGDPDSIAQTIKVGINGSHAETRMAQMPAFGRDKMLQRPDILALVDYVGAISSGKDGTAEAKKLFTDNCAACHGEDAKGVEGTGAPNLTDQDWIYGGDRQALFDTLMNGRQGQMPSWAGRLNEAEIRMLALYVSQLGAKP